VCCIRRRRARSRRGAETLELVLPDRRRFPLDADLSIGRSRASTVRLLDPSVSRAHALIRHGMLEDAGSTYGTWLDGRRVVAPTALRAGARIRVGEQELVVARSSDAGPTLVVPTADGTTRLGGCPRLRSGYALKRLEASEGEKRWLLKDLRSGAFVRLSSEDAELLGLIDGSRSVAALIADAERLQGEAGPERLTVLLAALAERGLLSGVAGAVPAPPRRWFAPRTWVFEGAGAWFARLYSGGGRALLTPVGLVALAALACAGLAAFVALVAGRYGTPFVVASKAGVGGVVFVLGRLAVAAVHETAHGLVLASFGRSVRSAGLKLVLIFPYVFVDTSDAWFEGKRRRIAVTAAGPVSDLCVGGAFAVLCLVSAAGTVRDVLFQVACGAYVGAFFNLNPGLDRDGHHIAVDLLRPRALRVVTVGWALVGLGVGVAMTWRYEAAISRVAPVGVVMAVMAALWALLLLPVIKTLRHAR
jgi:putative peptide zinc metalloprotease protein